MIYRMDRFNWLNLPLIAAAILLSGCAMKLGKQPRQEVRSLYSARSPEFEQAAGSLLGPNFVGGNSISTLVNGDEIFPAMLSAIRSAKRSVNFETYIFWDGEVAKKFTAALSDRARAGVAVNLILDAQGTQKMGITNKKQLQDAGATIVKYHSVLWLDPRRYNGASLVGLNGIVLKSHGSADQFAFENAVKAAIVEARKGVPLQIGKLVENRPH